MINVSFEWIEGLVLGAALRLSIDWQLIPREC